jgi:demethylmenaquinone methyltransferase/2-methoxy-6-polyprenyl-1,4-benzoquinol methylase
MLPARVDAALSRAKHAGFELSCDTAVGQLLAALAAAVPRDGRILELGTGCGVGLAWITHGLDGRADVEVVSIESDPEAIAVARSGDWPSFVSFVEGDGVSVLPTIGEFDLVFADAEGGKWERFDLTLEAVRLHGVLIVDDMTPARWESERHRSKTAEVRAHLLSESRFVSAEVTQGTGVILSTRVRS